MSFSLGILGITGKLGKSIALQALQRGFYTSIAGCASPLSPWKGKDLGETLDPVVSLGIPIESHPEKIFTSCDVIIDVSHFSATDEMLIYAREAKKPYVLGVTGYTAPIEKILENSAEHFPIFYAANFSPGIVLCAEFGKLFKNFFQRNYEIHIKEVHHIHKKDRPGGTAKQLANIFGKDLITIESQRVGEVIGEHTIVLENAYETLEIKHTAHTRDLYAKGALDAAHFLIHKPSGLYGMKDLFSVHENVSNNQPV